MTTNQHATYAPSSAHRWMACTASAEAIARLPTTEEGEEAAEGTRAHDEIERLLGHLNDRSSAYFLAQPINYEHPAAYGIALVLDYVRQLPPGTLWIEQRVRLTDEIWGRCDVAHWDPVTKVLTIIDYKNGFVDVQAEENEQLQIYAAATIMTRQLPAAWIRLVVVQPNSFLPVPRVKQWALSADALYAFASRAAVVPAGPKTFTPGSQCTYCPLFGQCPATRDMMQNLGALFAQSPDKVPATQYAAIAALKKPITDWLKAFDKAGTKKALAGDVPPGMMLVTTQHHRAWKPGAEEAAKQEIFVGHGIDALELPTPTQAKERKLITADQYESYSERPEGGPALAFNDDKRPPWKSKSAAEMFAGAKVPM